MEFMPRSGWKAVKPKNDQMIRFQGPVDYLIVTHTAINGRCVTNDECCRKVKEVQRIGTNTPYSKS